jgi:hypothetical protein
MIALAHAPAKHAQGLDPRVESGSDIRRYWNLQRFPFMWDPLSDPM